MNKTYTLCKYYDECPVSKTENKDCIYFEDCQVKRFYDRFGLDYLKFSSGINVGIEYEINQFFL